LLADDERFVVKTPAADDLSVGIQSVEVVGKNVGDVKKHLFDAHGIDTRPMSGFGINGVRISLAVYCTKGDVEELVKGLKSLL